jgi:predicted dehydrogenase
MAPNGATARSMLNAAVQAGVVTQLGFNYLKNPMIALAREMVKSGELGEIVSFRGIHAEDYMADPTAPWHWRLDRAIGGGVIQDLGSHIIAMARYLVGPIAEVAGQVETIVPERTVAAGKTETRSVEVDDIARALVRFERGCTGSLEASWVAQGRKMQIEFELTGVKGALHFNQERFNELRFYRAGEAVGRSGFRTICAGPEHEPYGAFCPAPGHQLGFNDLKTIEVRDFLRAIGGEESARADFAEGVEVQSTIDAILRSAREKKWVSVVERDS